MNMNSSHDLGVVTSKPCCFHYTYQRGFIACNSCLSF